MTNREAIKKAIEQVISNSYAEEFELLRTLFRLSEEAEGDAGV